MNDFPLITFEEMFALLIFFFTFIFGSGIKYLHLRSKKDDLSVGKDSSLSTSFLSWNDLRFGGERYDFNSF